MVYFMQGAITKNIKIGKTGRGILERLNMICSSDPIVCLKVADLKEREIHNRFRAHWSHGEWFKPDPELMAFIAALPGTEFDGLVQHPLSPWGRMHVARKRGKYVNQAFFNRARLRHLRENKLWSMRELGERVGVHGGQVSRWESGEARPRAYMVRKLTQVFQVPTEYFLSESVDAPTVMPEV